MKFVEYLDMRDSITEFVSYGPAEDWGDVYSQERRLNGKEYAKRGVRSKYVASMKSDTKIKKPTK